MITYKSKEDLELLRVSGAILSSVLKTLRSEAREGVRLSYLDKTAGALLKSKGAKSAFLGYRPEGAAKAFPAHICTSINDEVVHGLPRDYALKTGDVLKIDLGVDYEGMITDSATTVAIGPISKKIENLITATEAALYDAIAVAKPGKHLGDIGYAVQKIAERYGYGYPLNLSGHGVGAAVHEEPHVPNYGDPGKGDKLVEGLVIAIEPMFIRGKSDLYIDKDGFTYRTKDGSRTCHVEHTVLITKDGPEILTKV
jgi:methionyl aminopeptidase